MREERARLPSEGASRSIKRMKIKEESKDTRDSAAQYLDRVMGSTQEPTPDSDHRRHRRSRWESYRFGNDLKVSVRKPLTPAQKRQLKLAGQLLQSMLEKE